jgi:hypothetical protein
MVGGSTSTPIRVRFGIRFTGAKRGYVTVWDLPEEFITGLKRGRAEFMGVFMGGSAEFESVFISQLRIVVSII